MDKSLDLGHELRGRLITLLEDLTPMLATETAEIVNDLIDNREFGVALEWLYDATLIRKISLTVEQGERFASLAALMDIDLRQVP